MKIKGKAEVNYFSPKTAVLLQNTRTPFRPVMGNLEFDDDFYLWWHSANTVCILLFAGFLINKHVTMDVLLLIFSLTLYGIGLTEVYDLIAPGTVASLCLFYFGEVVFQVLKKVFKLRESNRLVWPLILWILGELVLGTHDPVKILQDVQDINRDFCVDYGGCLGKYSVTNQSSFSNFALYPYIGVSPIKNAALVPKIISPPILDEHMREYESTALVFQASSSKISFEGNLLLWYNYEELDIRKSYVNDSNGMDPYIALYSPKFQMNITVRSCPIQVTQFLQNVKADPISGDELTNCTYSDYSEKMLKQLNSSLKSKYIDRKFRRLEKIIVGLIVDDKEDSSSLIHRVRVKRIVKLTTSKLGLSTSSLLLAIFIIREVIYWFHDIKEAQNSEENSDGEYASLA